MEKGYIQVGKILEKHVGYRADDMASRLLRSFKFKSNQSSLFDKCLQVSWLLQKQCSYCMRETVGQKKFNEQNSQKKNDFVKYGAILTVFTACSLFFHSYKDRVKNLSKYLPTVHALDISDGSLRSRFNFIADVVEKSANAVVCIESRRQLSGLMHNVMPGGSGFIIKEDGLILTNAHVVINKPNCVVQVKLKDGRIFIGQIEDVDLRADLATIRIKAKDLPVMKLGSSSDLRAGEWVVAIGSPLSLTDSVSAGVVSSPQRKGEDLGMNFKDMHYIQTDAAITFGNSGGPLVNLDGEVVGVNSMKVTSGISFAIPIEYAKEFLKRGEEKKKIEGDSSLEGKKRGYIGVSMLTLTPELVQELNHKNHRIPEFLINGILICQVIIGSPAFNSGLHPGDVIAEINGEPVSGVRSIYKALEMGVVLNMTVYRRDLVLNVVIAPEQVI